MKKINYTPQGFSYIDVDLFDCISWGGLGVCDCCGKISKELKLIYVLHDTYCNSCFNRWQERAKHYRKEDIEYDLNVQKGNDKPYYRAHVGEIYD